jgi:uncharacterized protein with PIN domain
MEERFAADLTLGRLVKWLRILGYDTALKQMDTDRNFLNEAAQEGRIALTRKRDLARLPDQGRLIVVKADRSEEQLAEVLEALDLKPDPARRLSRCLTCNSLLEGVAKEALKGFVPAYVYESHEQFRRCPLCRKIFWPGTHSRHVEEYLRMRVPACRS